MWDLRQRSQGAREEWLKTARILGSQERKHDIKKKEGRLNTKACVDAWSPSEPDDGCTYSGLERQSSQEM